jgi:penicillin amidase
MKKVIVTVSLLILVIFVAIIGWSYYVVQRSQPLISGEVHTSGVKKSVKILRDEYGVPHIYADNLPDLMFAVGYVQAQDRLWQMDLSHHLVNGTISELIGEDAVELDYYHRTMGFARLGERAMQQLSPEEVALLQKFCDGINEFINTHLDQLPLEYSIVRHEPELVQPVELLKAGMMAYWWVSANFDHELIGLKIAQRLGVDALTDLFPSYPSDPPNRPPIEASFYKNVDTTVLDGHEQAESPWGIDSGIGASNNWVVDGAKSTSGKPLLANDPHLQVMLPSMWYMMHLVAPGLNVTGATFPGNPFVAIGHNQRIAWGFTNVEADNTDLYIEKVNPKNPRQYWDVDHWADMERVVTSINVRGEDEPVKKEILYTKHGPVITPVRTGMKDVLSLRWTAQQPGNSIRAFIELNRAQNWEQARAAVSHLRELCHNMVYADVDGNIGWQVVGAIPIRAKGDGKFPVPGHTGEYEWTGIIPFDELPRLYNPATHFVATANNKVVDNNYPHPISNSWSAPFRYQRIKQMLEAKEKHSVADFARMQGDTYSIFSEVVIKLLGEVKSTDADVTWAIDQLRRWDRHVRRDSLPAALYETLLTKLAKNTFADELGDLYKDFARTFNGGYSALYDIMGKPNARWWDDVTTPAKETRADIFAKSLKEAIQELDDRLGDDREEDWRWGALHPVVFPHTLGQYKPLDQLFNFSVDYEGDVDTVNRGTYSFTQPYNVRGLASLRMVVDLSDLNKSLIVITTGQSGIIGNSHYRDLTDKWASGQYATMLFDDALIRKQAEGTLIIVPAK